MVGEQAAQSVLTYQPRPSLALLTMYPTQGRDLLAQPVPPSGQAEALEEEPAGGGLVVDGDDKYQYCPPWAYAEITDDYCPPWAYAEITDDDTWVGLDAECLSRNPPVEWRTRVDPADGD